MRYIFSEYARFLPCKLQEQINELNNKVINEILPNIITNITQNIEYNNLISSSVNILENPTKVISRSIDNNIFYNNNDDDFNNFRNNKDLLPLPLDTKKVKNIAPISSIYFK